MTDPRAGEESTLCQHKVITNFCVLCGQGPLKPIPEETAGREATECAVCESVKKEVDAVIRLGSGIENESLINPHERRFCAMVLEAAKGDTVFISKWLRLFMNAREEKLEAQLAAQPSVQRDEDGIGWCSSCDKIHEVVRPKCPSCGDWLIFAADDKPEYSAKSFNDGVRAATSYLRGMHNMETLAFLTEKTVLRITAERGSK